MLLLNANGIWSCTVALSIPMEFCNHILFYHSFSLQCSQSIQATKWLELSLFIFQCLKHGSLFVGDKTNHYWKAFFWNTFQSLDVYLWKEARERSPFSIGILLRIVVEFIDAYTYSHTEWCIKFVSTYVADNCKKNELNLLNLWQKKVVIYKMSV